MTKIVLCLAFFVHVALPAQDMSGEKRAQIVSSTIGAEFVSPQTFAGKNVKGAPYSAQAVSETVQVLSDGNRITHTGSAMLYRDSQGRERREDSNTLGDREPYQSISISDPVEGLRYTFDTGAKTVRKMAMPALVQSTAAFKTLADIVKEPVSPTMMTGSPGSGRVFYTKIDTNEEDLGTQMIEGVSAHGTRVTTTVPVGAVGNERPIVTVNERWYSPELQILVMSTRSDPRTGTTTYKVTNINRAEQPRTLFEPPADYKVIDLTGYKSTGVKPEEQ